MPTFGYTGTQSGQHREGDIDAADQRAAITALRKAGVLPLRVFELKTRNSSARRSTSQQSTQSPLFERGVNTKDITAFTRQLATLVNAGFPLARALDFIQRQGDKESLRTLVGHVNAEVRGGASMSEALAGHAKHFDSLYTNMARAGETGGILPLLLERLAAMREADEALMSKIKGAMTYPAVMLLAMVLSLVVMFVFVVPKFAVMFEDMGQALPTPTVVMMAISDVFQHYWWAMAGLLAMAIAGPILWRRTPGGRYSLDRLLLNLPVFGAFATRVAMTRFCRTLGTLIDSGVNLVAGLEASRGVAGNVVIAGAIGDSLKDIKEGNKVGQTFAATGYFPPLVCEMITLGEESGKMGTMCLQVADIYDRQTDDLVKALTSVIEPLMILFMGGIVGMVVIAMLLPIFSMNLGV